MAETKIGGEVPLRIRSNSIWSQPTCRKFLEVESTDHVICTFEHLRIKARKKGTSTTNNFKWKHRINK